MWPILDDDDDDAGAGGLRSHTLVSYIILLQKQYQLNKLWFTNKKERGLLVDSDVAKMASEEE